MSEASASDPTRLDLVIRNGISDKTLEPMEVGIEAGVITAVAPAGLPPARQEIDAGGAPERLTDEIGDLLFVVVNLARHLGVDAEGALRHTNAKFERRFRKVEQAFDGKPEKVTLDEMEDAWQAAKAEEG